MNRWIQVSDSLPSTSCAVLVMVDGEHPAVSFYNVNQGFLPTIKATKADFILWNGNVTHWCGISPVKEDKPFLPSSAEVERRVDPENKWAACDRLRLLGKAMATPETHPLFAAWWKEFSPLLPAKDRQFGKAISRIGFLSGISLWIAQDK